MPYQPANIPSQTQAKFINTIRRNINERKKRKIPLSRSRIPRRVSPYERARPPPLAVTRTLLPPQNPRKSSRMGWDPSTPPPAWAFHADPPQPTRSPLARFNVSPVKSTWTFFAKPYKHATKFLSDRYERLRDTMAKPKDEEFDVSWTDRLRVDNIDWDFVYYAVFAVFFWAMFLIWLDGSKGSGDETEKVDEPVVLLPVASQCWCSDRVLRILYF